MTHAHIVLTGINPEPWQAPLGSVGRKKGGGTFVRMSTPPKQMAYQTAIRETIDQAYPEYAADQGDTYLFPKGKPLSIRYFFWRQLDKYQTESGRNMTGNRADLTNIVKATEDCLQGRLIWNDVEVVHEEARYMAQGVLVVPRILIMIDDDPGSFEFPYFEPDMTGAPLPPGNCLIKVDRYDDD